MFKNLIKKIKAFFGYHDAQIPYTPPSIVNKSEAWEMDTEKLVTTDELFLWGTLYYSELLSSSTSPRAIPFLDMNGRELGPKLDNGQWCKCAIEGVAHVDGKTYTYDGKTGSSQASCSIRGSELVRWKESPFRYGVGSKNNPLVPFRSIATDVSVIPFGTIIFIPLAVGIEFEIEGKKYIHDGYFRADDVGGAIKGTHIDFFIGEVQDGLSGALLKNPFEFIKSTASSKFVAYKTVKA